MGKGSIKGITIQIGGDATGLDKALSATNKKSRALTSELKAVDKALKLDPNNLTLVKQKQDLLNDSIKNTHEKLKTLEVAQSQVKKQFKSGQIDEGQYRAFQRELETTKKKLSSLKEEKKNIHVIKTAFKDVKEAVEPVTSKIKKVSSAIGTATTKAAKFTATLGKIDTAMIGKAANGFKAYTTAVAGASTAVAGFAINVGKDFESQISTVASISGATGKELEQLTAKAKEMGSTTQFSATESAQAMEYMAMAGWNTENIVNGLSGVMNLAAASGEDLATTSDIVTDAMTAFGMSADESGRFADVLAATATSANTDVATMGETFKEVAPLAGAMNYSIEDMSTAIGLMANAGVKGSKSGTALKNIITNLSDPTDEVSAAMEELGVSLTNADGSTKSFEAVVGDLRSSFANLDETQKAQYASTIAGKQGMSGLLALVNSSDEDFKKLSKSINNCSGAAEEMAKVKMDNLKGDLQILKSNAEGLGIELYEKLAPSLRESVQGVSELMTAFNENGVDGLINEIPNVVGNMFDNILGGLQKHAPTLITGITTVLTSIIQSLAQHAPQLIKTLLPALLNGFFGLINAFVSAVPTLVPALIDGAITLFLGLIDGLNQVIERLMPMLPDIITHITDALRENLPTIIEGGFQLLIGLIQGIADCTPQLIDSVISLIPVLTDALVQNIPALIQAGMQLIMALAEGLPKAIPAIIEALPEIIGAIWDGLKEVDWIELGANILEGILLGLKSAVKGIWKVVKEVGADIVDGFKSFFGINSPSRLMAKQIGAFLPPGIGMGMEETADIPVKEAEDIVNKVAGVSTDIDPIMLNKQIQTNFSANNKSPITTIDFASTGGNPTMPLPKNAVFNLHINGQQFAQVTAPFLDAVFGGRMDLQSRGVTT